MEKVSSSFVVGARVVLLGCLVLSGCGEPQPLACPAGTIPRAGACTAENVDGGLHVAHDAAPIDRDAEIALAPDAGCVPAPDPDVPDEAYVDADCDGVDGDEDDAIFVSSEGRVDGAGTRADPISSSAAASAAAAIAAASSSSRAYVLVATGTYDESIVIEPGISIVGGYDPSSWSRSDARATVRSDGPVLTAIDVAAPTRVVTIDFEARDATIPGTSSIAARLVRSSGVRLERVALTAGRGADGADGLTPPRPAQAASGNAGSPGVQNGTCVAGEVEPPPGSGGAPSSGCGCGRGGRGGVGGDYWRGSTIVAAGPGTFGCADDACGSMVLCGATMSGAPGSGGAGGRTGGNGASGAPGIDGAGAAPSGTFGVEGFVPADGASGTNGVPGDGGGGGGGGTGCSIDPDGLCRGSGGSGGGGGAGGCGGAGGSGGGGGGASIALYLWESSPTLVRVTARAADGGAGGDGALGGEGALGGLGGAGGAAYTPGGRNPVCLFGTPAPGGLGGSGGAGGRGGGGGGGTGGPSIGILLGAGSAEGAGSTGIVVTTGHGGVRGLGGGTAPTGENGLVQSSFAVGG